MTRRSSPTHSHRPEAPGNASRGQAGRQEETPGRGQAEGGATQAQATPAKAAEPKTARVATIIRMATISGLAANSGLATIIVMATITRMATIA
jgi:hypothetical protein